MWFCIRCFDVAHGNGHEIEQSILAELTILGLVLYPGRHEQLTIQKTTYASNLFEYLKFYSEFIIKRISRYPESMGIFTSSVKSLNKFQRKASDGDIPWVVARNWYNDVVESKYLNTFY